MSKHFFTLLRGIVASLLLCAAFTTAHAQQSEPTLTVWLTDGTSTDINLLAKPTVSIDGDDMVITSSEISLRYAVADIASFTYNENARTYTAIRSLQSETGYRLDGDRLVFHGLQASNRVALYTTNGTLVSAPVIANGNDAVLSLASIPSGVYLLNVNGKTIKITKP